MKCRKCQIEKPADGFYLRSDNFKIDTLCKACRKEAARLQVRGVRISANTFNSLHKEQKGRCCICDQKCKLFVDCGENRNVRGLLCMSCRNGLRYFFSKVDLLLEAINYLRETK